ncbi:MAG TPA: NB-ARC domain-containing protein, partial [Anaerolineaceae bacterium]|nr:NB-ARC domain-containing protein [Anaerolineaceae bacterium]
LLKCWSRNQDPSADLLEQMPCADNFDEKTATERSIYLQHLIYKLVEQALADQRQKAGVEPEPANWQDGLKGDFGANSPTLEAWSALYHRYLLPQQISVGELAKTASVVERQFRRRIIAGVNLLLQTLQHNALKSGGNDQAAARKKFIPQGDYFRLFGVDALIRQVEQALCDVEGPKFFSIEGIGGIGKTTLAMAAASRIAEQVNYAKVFWVSARPDYLDDKGMIKPIDDATKTLDDIISRIAAQMGQDQLLGLPTAIKLERLQPLLAVTPYLIVVDNLETAEDTQTILAAIKPLAGASRFLLTSRVSLSGVGFVQTFAVPELSKVDSLKLISNEISRRQGTQYATSSELDQIYSVVGGIPLALKLVAALACYSPIGEVLDGLGQSQSETDGQLFSYIYRQAWLGLDDMARQLLLSMLLISPDGEDIHWLRSTSPLSAAEFKHSLARLRDYNLVEINGTLGNPIYRLHRLTISFLHTDVLKQWQGASDD